MHEQIQIYVSREHNLRMFSRAMGVTYKCQLLVTLTQTLNITKEWKKKWN